jgi:hypothetical protein
MDTLYTDYPSVLKYTPIAVRYGPWMLNEEDEGLQHEEGVKYRLRISAPRSNRRGEDQYIADSITVDVPPDGVVRLKLLPSDRYLPKGRYIVEYFRDGCRTPVDVQDWVVPSLSPSNSYNFVLSDQDPILPLNIWRVLTVSPGDDWTSEYNHLTWRTTRPEPGTGISLTYTPAATLDQLLNFRLDNLGNIDRVRA